jgi:heme-degrading monooxygenase HmoA
MYIKVIHVTIDRSNLAQARHVYNTKLAFDFPGRRFHYMLESLATPSSVLCVTGWNSQVDANRYFRGEGYQRNLAHFIPLLQGDIYSREYEVVEQGFNLPPAVAPTPDVPLTEIGRILQDMERAQKQVHSLFFRMVEMYLKAERITEARIIYNWELLSGYTMPGYHFAYFCESLADPARVVSLSCWDSKVYADQYAAGEGYQQDLAQFADFLLEPPSVEEFQVIVPALALNAA